MPHIQGFYISKGNRKVMYPIITMGPATDCPSRKWCPFDRESYKKAGRKQCYAQVTERIYSKVLLSRKRNAAIIANQTKETLPAFVSAISDKVSKMATDKVVRFNEASDLSDWNIEFAVALASALKARGVRLYGYSKAPMRLIKRMRAAGAVVLQSERDFIAVPDEKTGEATGLGKCEGVCGPCSRCPDGEKSWIVEH